MKENRERSRYDAHFAMQQYLCVTINNNNNFNHPILTKFITSGVATSNRSGRTVHTRGDILSLQLVLQASDDRVELRVVNQAVYAHLDGRNQRPECHDAALLVAVTLRKSVFEHSVHDATDAVRRLNDAGDILGLSNHLFLGRKRHQVLGDVHGSTVHADTRGPVLLDGALELQQCVAF